MTQERPQVVIPLLAHRGYAARYPENTRPALTAAVEAGATMLEFDIQLTADRVPFLLHDETFARTGGDAACILDVDAERAAGIDVSEPGRFGHAYRGTCAPRLADIVADLLEWPDVTAFVELKRQSISRFGAAAVLDAVLPLLAPVFDRCVIISFEESVIRLARERTGCRIGWALRGWDDEHRAQALAIDPDYLFCNVMRLPPIGESWWSGRWTWVIYEIVDSEIARDLVARGAGIIETMAYVELAHQLAEGEGG